MKTQFYVKFHPVFRGSRLSDIRPVSVTKGRPRDPRGGYAVVQFSVDFDSAIFAIPEVVANIGAADAEIVAEVLPPFAPSTDAESLP